MANFEILETEINRILENSWQSLVGDPEVVNHYSAIFDRTSESGFYSGEGPRGSGELPVWSPNEAYMQSLEKMWQPVAEYLKEKGITLDISLRNLFPTTREYKDTPIHHRRVFVGQLCSEGKAVTLFMLTVPHSHEKFEYISAPHIQISKS